MREASAYRPRTSQLLDRLLVVSRATQNFVTVLADAGRLARLHFLGAVDPDRAGDGEHGVVLERHQHLVVEHLLVVRDVVQDADDAEHQPVAVEDLAPFGEIPGREGLVKDLDQLDGSALAARPPPDPPTAAQAFAAPTP